MVAGDRCILRSVQIEGTWEYTDPATTGTIDSSATVRDPNGPCQSTRYAVVAKYGTGSLVL